MAKRPKSFNVAKPKAPQARTPGSAKGKVRLAPDFNETPADFKDYK